MPTTSLIWLGLGGLCVLVLLWCWLEAAIHAALLEAWTPSPDRAARVDDGLEYEYHVHPKGWILVLAREPREPRWED